MAAIAQPSVQSLRIRMCFNGQDLAVATAFVVDSARGPLLITNRHNVTGRHQDTGKLLSSTGAVPNQLVVTHNLSGNLGAWKDVTEQLHNEDGAPRWIEHPGLLERGDFVALPLTELDGVDLYPYDVEDTGPAIQLGPADAVSVIGFPFGIAVAGSFPVWATGYIASEPSVWVEDLPKMLIDCRTRQGQSGSPVVAYRHSGGNFVMEDGNSAMFINPVCKFVGIYSGRIKPESDIGVVWNAEAIAQLVRSASWPRNEFEAQNFALRQTQRTNSRAAPSFVTRRHRLG